MSFALPWRRAGGSRVKAPASAAATYEVSEEAALVSDVFVVIAVLCVWLVLQLLVLGAMSQQRAQNLMYATFRTELAQATAPTGGVIALGKPVALLTLDGNQLVVAEGTDSRTMLHGPGHLRSSVLPGQKGTSVVYGKSRTFGRPFAGIGSLKVGAEIKATTAQGTSRYLVTGVRRAGDPTPQPLASGAGRLTLVTADGGGKLGALSAAGVVYVDARLASKTAFDPPGGRYTTVTGAELPMQRDFSSLPVLALALAGLGLVVAGAVVLRRRLGSVLAWLLMGPPLIAMLWVSTDFAMSLLPNLM